MGIVEEGWLLSWHNVFGVGGLLFLLAGAPVVLLVVRRPRLFWPMLLVVNTFGNGPRVLGYIILDEVFTGFIVLGALLRIVMHSPHRLPDEPRGFQRRASVVWFAYMVFPGWVGVVVTQTF